jgi:CubicO group peptidase (beta-lactamase class C family)
MARSPSRLAWILAPIGLIVAAIAGMWLFMSFAASALHPDPQAIPSVTRTEPSPQWSEAVNRARRSIQAGLSEQNLPGLSVAVGVGGSMVWAEGFGWAHIETRMPVTPDTRFRIGTASTVLTSAAAGVLLEKGRLRLDDEIQTYVPQFPKKQWSVTLRQLMAHVAETRGHCSLTAVSGPWKRWSTSHRVSCCSSRARNTGIRSTAGSW